MIWNAARGGMRSVVENYIADGLIDAQRFKLIHSYLDAGFVTRQIVLCRALAEYSWCLATSRVELVHLHAAMRGSFWRKAIFARIARLRGIPVVLHLHGSETKSFYSRQHPHIQSMIVSELEKATAVVVLSSSWQAYIAGIAPMAKIAVVPNYVGIPALVERKETQISTLLFLGAVGQRKGIFDLLTALAKARRLVPDLRLIVGGDGQVAQARQRAAELGLADCVEFLGWVGATKRAQLLNEAAIYVLPSHNEGLPMSVLEAMASGLCVITTDVGGLPELVTDAESGVMIKPGDTEALASAIVRLARDPLERRRLGSAARRRISESYSRETAIAALDALYADIEASARPSKMVRSVA